MEENNWLAERMKADGDRLHGIAYRMLGSSSEAEDAVQEAWLRMSRTDPREVENPGGWLTTVVARVCLDMLRSRRSRREDLVGAPEPVAGGGNAEAEIALADSVGLALLVVVETLPPAERIAFVLHDLFDLPFEQIAPIVDRTPAATRQLASRARRRVRGAPAPDASPQRQIVDAYLAAARGGDLGTLLTLLDPEVVLRGDFGAAGPDAPTELRGAEPIAKGAIAGGARAARAALVNGAPGFVVAPHGRLLKAFALRFEGGRIVEIEAFAGERLRAVVIALPP
jgi:RNA polymerase sigma-70 factor (ECF subfamily)